MKVPLSWLKEYLPLTQSPQELEEVLNLAGIEVESMEASALKFSGVVVGQVLETNKHPSADRLSVAKVTDGKEEFQVVCGAPNCRAGLKVAFAKIGAALPEFKIKKSKIRDVESFGMLCAADELGLGLSGEGIMELGEEFEVGKDLSSYFSDVLLDVSLTPNLGHCFSIYGIARELSALLNLPLKTLKVELKQEGDAAVRIELIDKRQCHRYACCAVNGIQVGPSPAWLTKKLESCGIRSINNVVDVGNLVMLEFGQPLHMFDADKIEGNAIFVVSLTDYKELEMLDDAKHLIPPEALLICDAKKPLAFAGVMGGKSSAVTEATKNVMIESAYFTPQAIRKTGRLLGFKTDSAQRFEKGIDPNAVVERLRYAAALLCQVAGGKASHIIDEKTHEFHEKKIACRPERVNALLGTTLSHSEIAAILRRLGMHVDEKAFLVTVPTFRGDITTEIDLVEEVARIYGYNNIPKPHPLHVSSTIAPAPLYLLEKEIRERLVAQGLQEMMTCDLISPMQAAMTVEAGMDKEMLISVLHSRSIDQSVLRSSLLPGLLQAVKYNWDHGRPNVAAFEVGRVHFKDQDQYLEPSVAGVILSGKRAPYHWNPKPEEFDFFDLKGILENLLSGMKIEELHFEPSHLHTLHPGRQARVKKGDAILGVLGEVHPDLVRKIDVPERIFFAEINLHELIPLIPKNWKVSTPSAFPGSERDWTVTMNETTPIENILRAIRSIPSRLLGKVELLDLYKSEQIGKDKKNVTFRFFYRDLSKTIAFETVEREHERITAEVGKHLGAHL